MNYEWANKRIEQESRRELTFQIGGSSETRWTNKASDFRVFLGASWLEFQTCSRDYATELNWYN